MRKASWFLLGIIIVSFLLALYYYPQMPEQMASHWNAAGQVDGHMGRFWGVFLLPIILVGLFLAYLAIPRIDPLKKNIKTFQPSYDLFMTALFVFLLYVYGISLVWNRGLTMDVTAMLIPALAILFYIIGIMVGKAKQNYLIGIRTPWTLADEEVWNITHRRAGKLFKVAAAIILVGLLFPRAALWIMAAAVLGIVAYTFTDSYALYKERHPSRPKEREAMKRTEDKERKEKQG
ncbi:MAG: SdpI family protein [DPANN group archaeon]|nr:SdpI family protein [DPANN group archaeon]